MKKIFTIFLLSFVSMSYIAAQGDNKYTILLTGASFASTQNGWFEIGCRQLNATPLNRAIGGEAIANTANRMIDGTLYSSEELDNIDAFVIMQVPDYKNYPVHFDRSNYAAAYDYVIKRYMSECYNLKDNRKSKYYGTKSGKPAVIVLCTDWHDARVTYNTSIKKLAEKWGLPIIEFNKYIGFSKKQLHPATQEQESLLYAKDTQTIDGTKYGWHPLRGEDKYIQQRMAAIFINLMQIVLPVK